VKEGTAIIVGAGPAGLTVAYELVHKTKIKPIVFEKTNFIGGISRTINYKGNRMDIGGHRFFSKSDRVMQWWQSILPFQTTPCGDESLDIAVQALQSDSPDGLGPGALNENLDRIMLVRNRLSRIYYIRKFFNYPLSLKIKTLIDLGVVRFFKIAGSYLMAWVFPIRPEKSLEDLMINRFGRELYRTFFKDYTEKVWGISCSHIGSEWGAQRIKGLSIAKLALNTIKKAISKNQKITQKETETSLIEKFLYPKYGPGQLWEEVARIVEERGGKIIIDHEVVGMVAENQCIKKAAVKNQATGEVSWLDTDLVFSTMPVKDLISSMVAELPEEVKSVAEDLRYRDFMTVGLLVKKLRIKSDEAGRFADGLIADTWIYIQEKDVKLARLQIFNNWSPYLVQDPSKVWLGLEYFCNEGDEMWCMPDDEFAAFAIEELAKIGFIDVSDVLDHVVIRVPKAYPAYFGSYDRFHVIREFIDKFENLFLIGRNGMHKYNNMDHSMLTAMLAVENVVNGETSKNNLWEINTERNYHEER